MNLRRRIEQAEAVTGASKPCPECGHGGTWGAYEVIWHDCEGSFEPEEFCETCGTQLSFNIDWRGKETRET